MLRRGAALACLLVFATSCANKPIVRTQTVEVEKPVIVDVPAGMTTQEPEPQLQAGDVVNNDLTDYIDALKAWGRLAYCKLEKIANLGPGADTNEACRNAGVR